MDSKDIKNLFEAYVAVYDEDLRDEIDYESLDEDLSFVDDLSDNELTQIMEEIFDETTITLDECINSLGFFLSEAPVITRGGKRFRERRAASSTARVTSSSDRRAGKTAERTQQIRMGRIAQAAQRAAEYPGKKAKQGYERAKTLAGGAVSAVAGGAAEAGRKMQSAKEKIKGFLGKVGKAAKAGYRAAKSEFSGEAASKAATATKMRKLQRAARKANRNAAAKDTSEFEEEFDNYDLVLSHLIDEGYADTYESAEKIMVNMSEEWIEDILSEADSLAAQQERRRKRQAANMKKHGTPGFDYSKPREQVAAEREASLQTFLNSSGGKRKINSESADYGRLLRSNPSRRELQAHINKARAGGSSGQTGRSRTVSGPYNPSKGTRFKGTGTGADFRELT